MKTRIVVEHGGKRYRIVRNIVCNGKNCDLFTVGKCDRISDNGLPCDSIMRAMRRSFGWTHYCCYKEIK